ncbi:hypothetical protein Tco_0651563 [Tanacetum coccineum]|uniref:Uncharacterized protein n=1 Tax=Tanacetum coccineum TaxID=301880 RepID=A0ABQ4WV77_9ASTR
MMDNEVGNTSPQILPSVEEYTPPMTYLEEVEETLGTPVKVEPLDHMKLEDVGLDTCKHDISFNSMEVPSFDEPKPQPQPLLNCPSLDVNLGDKRGPKPPIKPYSPDTFRMMVVDNLTILTPPSPLVAHFHPKAFRKHLEEKHVTWARFRKKLHKNANFQAGDFHHDAFTKSA